ncbi:hypothetical protein ACSBL2_24640 [Pedobacter sp. AW31-3R]|uniref:hypothetical protein n=1 Tax=Pedobacter sp. AW31-3R TaxID=3445781 RepID=UPI003FA14E17
MGIEEVVLEGMLEDAKLEGKELGKEQGIKLGEELGELKKQNEIIAEMLKIGLSHAIIANIVKIPIEEVTTLSIQVQNNNRDN